MYASHYSCTLGMTLLLERGADPFWINNKGDNVIKMFARRGQVEMADACEQILQKPISKELYGALEALTTGIPI